MAQKLISFFFSFFFTFICVFSRHQAAKAQSYKQCKWKTMTMCADLAQASSFFISLRPLVVVSHILHLSSRMAGAHLIRAAPDLEETEEAYGPRECWSRWLMTWPQEATVPDSEDTLLHRDKRSRWAGITGQNEQNNQFDSASGSSLFSHVISCYLVIRVRSFVWNGLVTYMPEKQLPIKMHVQLCSWWWSNCKEEAPFFSNTFVCRQLNLGDITQTKQRAVLCM